MDKKYIKWCTSHYSLDVCNEVKKQLRKQGFKCITKDYVKENRMSYARVYIEKNDYYYSNRGTARVDLKMFSRNKLNDKEFTSYCVDLIEREFNDRKNLFKMVENILARKNIDAVKCMKDLDIFDMLVDLIIESTKNTVWVCNSFIHSEKYDEKQVDVVLFNKKEDAEKWFRENVEKFKNETIDKLCGMYKNWEDMLENIECDYDFLLCENENEFKCYIEFTLDRCEIYYRETIIN